MPFPAETANSFAYLVVYAESTAAEQTTPAAVELTDVFASVSTVTFHDLGLDASDLGGSAGRNLPADETQLQTTSFTLLMMQQVLIGELRLPSPLWVL